MTLSYYNGDLFQKAYDYYLVHCVSADFALGAGIARQFDLKYGMRVKLLNFYHSIAMEDRVGKTFLIENCFNLVTKRDYWQKPTYETLKSCLYVMKDIMLQRNINKIAMPLIGCGLDRLQWEKVEQIIKDVFNDMSVEIVVCVL